MGSAALITKTGWKLIEIDREADKYQLYHVLEDNEERHNLESSRPEIVARLKTILLSELDSPRPDL